jgi:hypothetical protein
MDELDEIDSETIRYGWRRYKALLTEAEQKMQELITFWRDCGLVTGRRTPPNYASNPSSQRQFGTE